MNVATAWHRQFYAVSTKNTFQNVYIKMSNLQQKKANMIIIVTKQYPTVSYTVTWQKNNVPNIKKWKITIIFTRQKKPDTCTTCIKY